MWFPLVAFFSATTAVLSDPFAIHWCEPLHYRAIAGKDSVALVAYPASGSTWLRYLLQQVTGIYTGSYRADEWNESQWKLGNDSKRVLLFEMQGPLMYNNTDYTKAILLIRHPGNVIVALHDIGDGGDQMPAPDSTFEGPKWNAFVHGTVKNWTSFYSHSLAWMRGPLHIEFYERLAKDTRNALVDVLTFLDVRYNEEDLKCALSRKDNAFNTEPPRNGLHPFSYDHEQMLRAQSDKMLDRIERYNKMYRHAGWVKNLQEDG